MKKISIIIPLYNAERFIQKNLESIYSQGVNDYEVIIVNDGSTDNSEKVVKSFIDNKKNFKYIYQMNSGAPAARNNGISNASGQYFLFLDSDDYLEAGILEKYLRIISEENYDLIVANFKSVDENGKFLTSNIITESYNIQEGEQIFMSCVKTPVPGNKLYNASLIKKYNLKFDDVKIGQDLNFYEKYLLHTQKILYIDEFAYNYRIVLTGISKTYTKKILGILDSFEYIKAYYLKNNKMNLYNKYIVFAELLHYYYQFCKIRHISEKSIRKEIYEILSKKNKQLKIEKNTCLYKKNKKLYFKIRYRFFIGRIFTLNFYCKIFKILRKGK